VTTYCFVKPFSRAKYCGVPSEAIAKDGCAVGKKSLWNTASSPSHYTLYHLHVNFFLFPSRKAKSLVTDRRLKEKKGKILERRTLWSTLTFQKSSSRHTTYGIIAVI
jgi:hypothetical protein